jgi:hypothetical protein
MTGPLFKNSCARAEGTPKRDATAGVLHSIRAAGGIGEKRYIINEVGGKAVSEDTTKKPKNN